jgi:hypothetical protein
LIRDVERSFACSAAQDILAKLNRAGFINIPLANISIPNSTLTQVGVVRMDSSVFSR